MTISSRNTKLFIASQFLYALVFTIPIWIVYYQSRISVAQISFLIAFQYAVQLILEMPTGALADLVGRKICVALGYLLWSVSFLFIIFSQGFLPLIVATFLSGVAESLLSGSLEALVFDSLKQDKKESEFQRVSAKNSLLFQVALAFATLLGGFLYQFYWWLPYLFCIVANFLAFCLSLWFVEPEIDSESFSLSNYVKQIKEGSVHVFVNKKVATMSIYYIFVAGITWSNNLYFFDYMLVELGFADATRGVVGAFIRIFNLLVMTALLGNSKLFTRKRSIYFFPIIMIICFLPGFLFSGWWALPFVAGAVMAGTARFVVLSQYTNEMFESKYRATAISVLSMVVGVLFVVITSVSGIIIDGFGGVRMMYTLLGVSTLLTVLPLSMVLARSDK